MRKLVAGRLAIVRREGEDRGAALVAAIGVMIIALSLGALVVSQAVMSQRDSGRNRARTVEIHSAEAGVDSLYARMQKGEFVCSWQTTEADALGPDDVGAAAQVSYWDADGNELDCSGDTVSWVGDNVPARARILVTSENASASMAGIEPKRSFESEVLLNREVIAGEGAAVFSADGIMTTNGATVTTLDESSGTGNIWVDKGNVDCNSSFTADGNLYVPDGNLKMSGNCNIQGDAWVSGSTALNQSPTQIGGDLWSKAGPVVMESGTTVGGIVTTGGAITCRNCNVSDSRPNTPIDPFHQSQGLPEVTFNPSDWAGFTQRNYYEVVRESAVRNGALTGHLVGEPPNKVNQCKQLEAPNYSLGGALYLPTTNSILDARDCDFTSVNIEVVLSADTVIFANSFRVSNGFNVRSVGGDHTLWLIVPDPVKNGVAQCTGGIGNIETSGSVTTRPEASIFLYTPCIVNLSNTGIFYGQIYGSPVNLRNGNDVVYVPIGIPGVDLMPGYVDVNAEWDVDVVYKRETGDRVG